MPAKLSLGTGAFYGVGAYACFKLVTIFPEMNILFLCGAPLSGFFSATVGMAFGLPSLRDQGGFTSPSATLAAQFFPGLAVPEMGLALQQPYLRRDPRPQHPDVRDDGGGLPTPRR